MPPRGFVVSRCDVMWCQVLIFRFVPFSGQSGVRCGEVVDSEQNVICCINVVGSVGDYAHMRVGHAVVFGFRVYVSIGVARWI